MSSDILTLGNDQLTLDLDPWRGADVLRLFHRRRQVDVLFEAPWRARADGIRNGQPPSSFDPVAGWLEQYRGGWQTLCPNAGPPRSVHGAPVGFHGEASSVPWTVTSAGTDRAELSVELFSVPVVISRAMELEGPSVRIADTITNLSGTSLEFDYSSHPALGGPLLEGECVLQTGARRFTSDPTTDTGVLAPGSEHAWPWAQTAAGDALDLRHVPPSGVPRALFGWLHDFSDHWASVTNLDLGLTVRLDWDGRHLPYAWLWQELSATEGFPWFGRARTVAIEPASMQTSGSERHSVLRLGPRESIDLWLTVGIEEGSA